MLAIIIAPFFIALQGFVIYRTLKHLRTFCGRFTNIILAIYGFLLYSGIISMVIAFLLPAGHAYKRLFSKIGFYWLGIILYFFVGLILCLIARLIVWAVKRGKNYSKDIARHITIGFVLVFTTIMSIYGIVNAHDLKVTNYEVSIDKDCNLDELNVVLLADLHLGYNDGLKEMQEMVDKVNEQNADLVVIAGDIFDNEYEAIEEPEKMIEILKGMKSKYGTYVVYGNHDIQEKILCGFTFEWSKEDKSKVQADERMNEFIQECGFHFLYDDYVMIEDSIYLYGRPDASKINFGNSQRLSADEVTEDFDKSLPIIVIEHEPGELNELSNAGVDLDLCGHTHDGQVWPGTITINLFWDNAYGLKEYGNMTNIVTSGVGLFGPNMRTGCHAEICNIKVHFKK